MSTDKLPQNLQPFVFEDWGTYLRIRDGKIEMAPVSINPFDPPIEEEWVEVAEGYVHRSAEFDNTYEYARAACVAVADVLTQYGILPED